MLAQHSIFGALWSGRRVAGVGRTWRPDVARLSLSTTDQDRWVWVTHGSEFQWPAQLVMRFPRTCSSPASIGLRFAGLFEPLDRSQPSVRERNSRPRDSSSYSKAGPPIPTRPARPRVRRRVVTGLTKFQGVGHRAVPACQREPLVTARIASATNSRASAPAGFPTSPIWKK